MEPIFVAKQAPCSVGTIRKIRHLVEQLLLRAGEQRSIIDETLLALSEHLANLVRHTENTRCDVIWDANNRTLTVCDDGPDNSDRWATVSTLESLQTSEPQTSGMGMALIASMFPQFAYRVDRSAELPNTLELPLRKEKVKIAIIDDDPTMLMIVNAFLEEAYEPRQFESVEAVLASTELTEFRLFICDVHMPDRTGPELRQILLQDESTELVPFIFLTGDTTEDRRQQASHLQIDDYLTKPIDKAMLLSTVERILNRSSRVQAKMASKLDHSISRSLWPMGPWSVGGCQVTYDYAVAERGGGDFLFSKQLRDRMRFVLGDVMGHGEQAKFYAFAISGFLTGLCASLSGGKEPAEFMQALSDSMSESALLERTMVTLLVVDVLDNREIRLCSAGHPPPLLLQSGQPIREVPVSGALPGLSVCGYEQTQIALPEQASLFCYTDGLVESLLFADDATPLIELLNSLLTSNTLNFQASEFSRHLGVSNRQLDDDLTLLTVF